MRHYSRSIPIEILNQDTGELESKRFTEDRVYVSSGIKQGWRRMYIAYDEVMESLKSQKEIQLFIHIRNMFTKSKSYIGINQTKIAKEFGISREMMNRFIRKLITLKFIQKQEDSTYKMNPFMFIPYQADAKILQKEWIDE